MRASSPTHLVVIFGPPAMGKMSVGQALADVTGFRLLHNHMSIELALRFFEYGTEGFHRINSSLRRTIFEAATRCGLPGVLFTYVWQLDDPHDNTSLGPTEVARQVARHFGLTMRERG